MMINTELDHLVVAASTLQEGVEYIEDLFCTRMAAGGEHATQGTHNRLLALSGGAYLEVIAINPDAPGPQYPRWFDLDSAAMQIQLSRKPKLITWVARSTGLSELIEKLPFNLGEIQPMARRGFKWKMTLSKDGKLYHEGVFPLLIEWLGDAHPVDSLPDCGCELISMTGKTDDARTVRRLIELMGLQPVLDIVKIEDGSADMLSATVRTPSGIVVLE